MNGPHQLTDLVRQTDAKLEANLAERKLLLKLRRHLCKTIDALDRTDSTPQDGETPIQRTFEKETAR